MVGAVLLMIIVVGVIDFVDVESDFCDLFMKMVNGECLVVNDYFMLLILIGCDGFFIWICAGVE